MAHQVDHSHINPDKQYSRFSVKLFRRLSQFLIGVGISRTIAFIGTVPGLHWFTVAVWAAWAVCAIPSTLQVYANLQSGRAWCEGINPGQYLMLWLVAIALLVGVGLEWHRISVGGDS